MLSYTVLCCPILSYTVLCCPILSYAVLYCPMLSYTVISPTLPLNWLKAALVGACRPNVAFDCQTLTFKIKD